VTSLTYSIVLRRHFTGKDIITTHKCPRWMQDCSYHERAYIQKTKVI